MGTHHSVPTAERPEASDKASDTERDREQDRLRRRFARRGSLTRRILFINVLALAIFVGGILYIGAFREGLVEARVEALTTQGELIAGALGEAAIGGALDEPKLDGALTRQIIRRVMSGTETRARLFGQDEELIADSRQLVAAGRQVEFETLPPPDRRLVPVRWLEAVFDWIIDLLPSRRDYALYTERPDQRASDYPEVVVALQGDVAGVVRIDTSNRLVISVAVPVQLFKQVLGALMLSVDSRDIEEAVRAEQLGTLKVFVLTLGVTALMSLVLASTIARPIRRLAAAADRVRTMHGRKVEIPDLGNRRDEIGELADALHDMTEALYRRMDAIETFAADVAHELKNPLTSLRSAVETLARTSDSNHREKLLEIVKDDVRRLDMLISDISDASRVDAEMSRAELAPVRVDAMLETFSDILASTRKDGMPKVSVDLPAGEPLIVSADENRLGQVIRNLTDNALSFSPRNGEVRLSARRTGRNITIAVEDDGPGLPEDKLEAVFNRFYTERPSGETFGTHSGLGLSISRQIVEAHGGRLTAENRHGAGGAIIGARFAVTLPARN
ncbi:MAG: stimulus-sensing domain-containing protein [Minwuiales bacterium]|nr:stimulus-sensing domain-containing protein [Minwuiales bacterium]